MPQLDLYKLHIFCEVVKTGSFSAAGERLLMTQPAISQHVLDLEEKLGAVLFVRGRRGVTPTVEGRVLYEHAQRILALVAEAESAVADVAKLKGGSLALGVTPGVGMYLLPAWLQDFRERHPRIAVTTHTATTERIAADTKAHTVELGFVEGELEPAMKRHVTVKVLCDVPQRFVVGPRHALWAQRTLLDIDALSGQSFITRQKGSQTRDWLEQLLTQHGVPPLFVAEFDNPESIKRAIAAGTAMGVLPAYATRQEEQAGLLRALPLRQPHTRALSAIWPKDGPGAIARAFVLFADACIHSGIVSSA
jgi:DNA-binding transcriptional LysR family regulator